MPASPSIALPRLRLLAAPALVRADGSLSALERKDAALLALLALDGPQPRARAAALLWPDAEPQKARNNLRQRLFRLRRAAGCDLILETSALSLAEGIAHDLGELPGQLARDPTAAAGELLGTCGYEDCDELDEWVRAARERFRSARRDALTAATTRDEADGHLARALLFGERLVADDPLSEQSHRFVMRLHYRRGDRAAALAAYARCRQVLTEELGTDPSSETRELALLIERAGALPGKAARPLPVVLAHPPRLVGRDAEWQRLSVAWDGGRVPLLTGDAGMGKTRLLTDFARSRAIPIVGARPGDERVPFALLARVLRAATVNDSTDPAIRSELARVLPELGSAPPYPLSEARFRQAVVRAMEERRADGVTGLALDDLHFADEASLQQLPSLLDAGLAIALAARAGELPAALVEWRHIARGDSLSEIALGPLTEADVRALLESLQLDVLDTDALAGPLAHHTGGNPFFVLETLGALIAHPGQQIGQLPSTPAVGALIERRLGQLSPAALRLARVGALAGPDFDAALAAHVLQQHPLDLAEAWSELERAHVLRDHGLAHDLVRDAIARSVPVPIAEWLHRGIAEYLESHAGAPARIAHHCEQARLWPQAARCHLRAADDARGASRRSDELTQRDAAAACFDRAGDADAAFDTRSTAIESALLVRGVDQAQQRVLQLLSVARTDAQKAAALTARATVALMGGDHVTGVATAREALALADRLGQSWTQFEASRLLAIGLSQQGNPDAAETVLSPFEAQVVLQGTVEQRGHYWADLAYVLNSARRLRRTADALERASACARELGDLAELATLTTNLATVHGNLGHSESAYEHALRARALQVELGDAGGPTSGVIEAHVGLYAAALGRYDAALQSFERAIDLFQRDGQSLWVAVTSNNLAGTYMDLGQFARARKALDHRPPNVAHVAARGALLAARLARALGSSPSHDLERATEALAKAPDFYVGAQLQLERAELLVPHQALPIFDNVVRDADAREYGGVALKARLLAARAALQSGDTASAIERWNEIERLRATLHADCYPPLIDAVGRDILIAHRDRAGAAKLLAAAIGWIHDTALPHVPEAFRDSFLHRNPVNRTLLTAASRQQ